jgi:hypothetical protein
MNTSKTLHKNVPVQLSDEQFSARHSRVLPSPLHQATVGQLLGDGHADRSSPTSNTRLSWSFGAAFSSYANFISGLYALYCNTGLKSVGVRAKKGGDTLSNYRLKTVTLPIFNIYHDMFYVFDATANKYMKIVPSDIKELMSPITLAHLIMGDGNYDEGRNRVRIYTNSFTHADCLLLAEAITSMGITTQVMKDKVGKDGSVQYVLTIGALQLGTLRECVGPHMDSSMLYRIGL